MNPHGKTAFRSSSLRSNIGTKQSLLNNENSIKKMLTLIVIDKKWSDIADQKESKTRKTNEEEAGRVSGNRKKFGATGNQLQ